MKRVGLWFLVTLLFCISIMRHPAAAGLFKDTDTAEIIRQIRIRNNPISWFKGDWPLQNHFYRPVSTLSFEFDNKVHGDDEVGYAQTNRIICCICVLLLFWLVCELSGSPGLATLSAGIFSLWQLNNGESAAGLIVWISLGVAAVGAIRHRGGIAGWLWIFAVGVLAQQELKGITQLASSSLDWLPGRTATVMTIFCLASMAGYARYLRFSATRRVPEPSSTDVPATKSSRVAELKGGAPWLVLSLVACWLALSSYEQAVMLPACLVGVAVMFKMRGYQVNWWSATGGFVLLAVYLLLRKELLPTSLSAYQNQQLRFGPSVLVSLLDYIFIVHREVLSFFGAFSDGFAILATPAPYTQVALIISNLLSYVQLRRHLALALGGLVLSLLAFLPMAFSKPFNHYHYWPMGLRSLFVAVLLWIWLELVVIAVSRPTLQAPQRLHPAPGSLPRP